MMGEENEGLDQKKIETWVRFRDAARLESEFADQRLTWMLTSQGFIFTAFALLLRFSNHDKLTPIEREAIEHVTFIVPTIGLFLALFGLLGALSAGFMHWKWTTRLINLKKFDSDETLPFGSKPTIPSRVTSAVPSFIAWTFMSAWIYLILVVNYDAERQEAVSMAVAIPGALSLFYLCVCSSQK